MSPKRSGSSGGNPEDVPLGGSPDAFGLPTRPSEPTGPGRHVPPDAQASASRSRAIKAIALAAVAIVLVLFALRNSQRVNLDFLVTSGHPRLIFLIVGCVLVGGVVGYFLGRPGRALRRRRGDRSPGE